VSEVLVQQQSMAVHVVQLLQQSAPEGSGLFCWFFSVTQCCLLGVLLCNVGQFHASPCMNCSLHRVAALYGCRETPLGAAFFSSVATPRTVKNILCQAYANDAAVTDELVDAILKPGLQVCFFNASLCCAVLCCANSCANSCAVLCCAVLC
jgi:hypothetical protein